MAGQETSIRAGEESAAEQPRYARVLSEVERIQGEEAKRIISLSKLAWVFELTQKQVNLHSHLEVAAERLARGIASIPVLPEILAVFQENYTTPLVDVLGADRFATIVAECSDQTNIVQSQPELA
ncbi:MAG: hypothetical protein JWO47_687 [Candidatus Saccharibacteria bacterium]|nr:hypothetical protein [Candidatus Saccharibacteria bacterium]